MFKVMHETTQQGQGMFSENVLFVALKCYDSYVGLIIKVSLYDLEYCGVCEDLLEDSELLSSVSELTPRWLEVGDNLRSLKCLLSC